MKGATSDDVHPDISLKGTVSVSPTFALELSQGAVYLKLRSDWIAGHVEDVWS